MHVDQEGTERQKEKQTKGMPHVCWFLGRVLVSQCSVLIVPNVPFHGMSKARVRFAGNTPFRCFELCAEFRSLHLSVNCLLVFDVLDS